MNTVSKLKTEPNKSVGGTFFYDAEGNFLRHKPTTAAAKTPEPTRKSAGKSDAKNDTKE